MPAPFLLENKCYFGGGTAVVLTHGEYRLSLDVDFLCDDTDGYRELRSAVKESSAAALFGTETSTVRDFKADQYGIRGVVSLSGQHIKFEILREARIRLDGAISPDLGVPILSRESQFSEKLLANADRCLDRSVAYRDAIDLGYLIGKSSMIPAASIAAAERAYGKDILRSIRNVLERLSDLNEVTLAADTLRMQSSEVQAAAFNLREASVASWPGADLPQIERPKDACGP